jgi:hypothetical protein
MGQLRLVVRTPCSFWSFCGLIARGTRACSFLFFVLSYMLRIDITYFAIWARRTHAHARALGAGLLAGVESALILELPYLGSPCRRRLARLGLETGLHLTDCTGDITESGKSIHGHIWPSKVRQDRKPRKASPGHGKQPQSLGRFTWPGDLGAFVCLPRPCMAFPANLNSAEVSASIPISLNRSRTGG